jgi:tRNA(Ile)-lysidine synthase
VPLSGTLCAERLSSPVRPDEFAVRLDRLGPFEPRPHLAVAVSGGADSLCLAILAADWVRARGGRQTALVVDHGLRAESADEASWTAERLRLLDISATVLIADGLVRGPAMAARARRARYDLLTAACTERGIVHLLLGHHRADQAETLALREEAGSGPAGLAGMAALVETADLRLLRPLLDLAPGRLRATLRARGLRWVDDPSNADPSTPRARLRAAADDADGAGAAIEAASRRAADFGCRRSGEEREAARWLARHAEIRPEGYALLDEGPWEPVALAALLRLIAGAEHAPSLDRVARLATSPKACTLGGVRIAPAGKWRPGGWMVMREIAAMEGDVPAMTGTLWDDRFRMLRDEPAGTLLGALGDAAAKSRGMLPAKVLRTVPALRTPREPHREVALHLSTPDRIVWAPPRPAACAPFAGLQPGC